MSEQNGGQVAELERWAELYLPPWVDTEDLQAARAASHYLSPRLRKNPLAELDPLTEVTEFVEQWPQERLRAAQLAYEEMTEDAPLPTGRLRAVVPAPVAYDEHPKNFAANCQPIWATRSSS